ncbi:RagB/SusD family nutrient uptake outer membrane protein [Chitinophaga horti]|uniref:RagB/SusD family nutrient uptake outer membrane protein n=1 Tax=Chitinophaga horti TaxID=2920382 RepID=A0ABY6IZ90_9BACT|nr:RagB/SusD family nutrient uptake outer membrane protein [Chitinophaga horti]UYQ91451.1 RagB/SusD family nutrient uptake outer membrane protein [Chitinophaga horti]
MTRFKKCILALALAPSMLGACNSDLNEIVYSDVTEQNYTYDNATTAMGIVYANMRSLFGHTNFYMAQETTSDELVMPANPSGWDDGGIFKRMHLHTWNSENPQLLNMWNILYRGVTNSNRVIAQLESGKVPPPTGVTKESLIAEMRAARAFFYWLICDNFGDAPLVTTIGTELPEKATRKNIYDFIVTELNEAIPDLSKTNGTAMHGRFNEWAARALLANIYLNAKVYVGEDKWGDCLTQCNEIINSGKYSLEDNFRDVFRTQNENSPEIVFAIPFDENRGGGFFVDMFSWHAALRDKRAMQITPWGSGSAMGVPQFIDTYDPADKRLGDTWLMGQQFALDGTTPLKGSYDIAGQNLVFTKNLPDGLFTGEAEGYRMNKFEIKIGARFDLSNDFPFFRYAQVLMMKAECMMRTGDADGAALLVTDVRRRSFTDPVKANVSGAALTGNTRYQYGYVENYQLVDPGNTAVVPFGGFMDELGWEFAWEAQRRRDNIRFGVYTTKSWLSHKPQGADRATFMIPQVAVNANPKLK